MSDYKFTIWIMLIVKLAFNDNVAYALQQLTINNNHNSTVIAAIENYKLLLVTVCLQ